MSSNFENFYFRIVTNYTSMYICLLPQNQLLCQQVAIIIIQLDRITIHIPTLFRIELGLGSEQGPVHRKFLHFYRIPLYIDAHLSSASKPAPVLASRYNYNAAS